MRRSLSGIALLALLAGCGKRMDPDVALTRRDPIVVRNVGFATPEAVLHDPLQDVYFVSNINGAPDAADDNGFISVVLPDGTVRDLKWIDGAADSVTLNGPKGMTLLGRYLYVADLNTLRRFDRNTGAPGGEVVIPGATFLNALAFGDDGSIYLTDSGLKLGAGGLEPSGTDAVYRLHPDNRLDTLARGEGLGRPNGIALSGDSVWVVSFGSGELYRVAGGEKVAAARMPSGALDGLIVRNGEAFISSWDGKAILRGPLAGPFAQIVGNLAAPAAIGFDNWRQRLLVPLFNDNELRIIPLVAF